MIEAVFLHAPGDRTEASACAAQWPGGGAACVDTGAGALTFGESLLACGVWAGAGTDLTGLCASLTSARRRAVILALQPLPPELANLGAAVVETSGDLAADVARLHAMAGDIRNGVFPMPAAPPVAARERKPRPVRDREEGPAPPVRASAAAFDPIADARRTRGGRGMAGFAVGAVVGLALFFGFAAPRLGAWLNRRETPPPIVIAPHEAAVAPAHQELPPIEPIDDSAIAAPAAAPTASAPAPSAANGPAPAPQPADPLRGVADPEGATP